MNGCPLEATQDDDHRFRLEFSEIINFLKLYDKYTITALIQNVCVGCVYVID